MEPCLAKETMDEGYDWTLCIQSGFIGPREVQSRVRCSNLPPKTSRTELRSFIHDAGSRSVVPLWTGPEYLYNMLRHNGVDLPEEAFVVLRLFAMEESEREEFSKHMEEVVDHDSLGIVQDFCDILESARQAVFTMEELDENSCVALWDVHFARIFEKYGADRVLQW